MNILGFVFSLLLILSYSFYASWEKHNGATRLRSSYLGHSNANRKILNAYEREFYKGIRYKRPLAENALPKIQKQKKIPIIQLNQHCAKLNLLPLIQEGREAHPFLYEMTAQLLRTFYSDPLFSKTRSEYKFLDMFLASARSALEKDPSFPLEKLALKDASLQMVYYRMLKGTKESYPSLLDYIKLEQQPEKICLCHAHPNLLTLLFGPKAGSRLFLQIHQEKAAPTKELIEKACLEAHMIALDPALLDLIELGARPNHKQGTKKTLIEEDPATHISLRKNVYLDSNS